MEFKVLTERDERVKHSAESGGEEEEDEKNDEEQVVERLGNPKKEGEDTESWHSVCPLGFTKETF